MTRVRPAREPNLILNRAGEDANGRREDAEADDRDGVATEVARVRREEGRGAGNSSDGGLNRRLNHRRRGDRTRDLGRGRCDIKKKTEKTGVRNRMEAKRAVRRVQKLLLFFCGRRRPPQRATETMQRGESAWCRRSPRSGAPLATKQLATASAQARRSSE